MTYCTYYYISIVNSILQQTFHIRVNMYRIDHYTAALNTNFTVIEFHASSQKANLNNIKIIFTEFHCVAKR